MWKTFAFSCAALLLSSPSLRAQLPQGADTAVTVPVRGIQYQGQDTQADSAYDISLQPLLAGISVSYDLCGGIMSMVSPWGQQEASLRINLKNRYFVAVEAGVGISDYTNETTGLHYKTNHPYFRFGADCNILKNLASGNRVFIGLRYAFTYFSYDLEGEDITDPVWGDATPYSFSNVKSGVHWAEALAGIEGKLWRFVRIGWTFRYRFRIAQKVSVPGEAWYVPGYGLNDGHTYGGTFYISFEL